MKTILCDTTMDELIDDIQDIMAEIIQIVPKFIDVYLYL